jgi:hypothetical protein
MQVVPLHVGAWLCVPREMQLKGDTKLGADAGYIPGDYNNNNSSDNGDNDNSLDKGKVGGPFHPKRRRTKNVDGSRGRVKVHLSSENPVSKFCFQIQLVPLRRGSSPGGGGGGDGQWTDLLEQRRRHRKGPEGTPKAVQHPWKGWGDGGGGVGGGGGGGGEREGSHHRRFPPPTPEDLRAVRGCTS